MLKYKLDSLEDAQHEKQAISMVVWSGWSFQENEEVLIDPLTFLATNDVEGQAIIETTANEKIPKQMLRIRMESLEHTDTVSTCKYDLTTKARQVVVGRYKWLDEGAGRQT